MSSCAQLLLCLAQSTDGAAATRRQVCAQLESRDAVCDQQLANAGQSRIRYEVINDLWTVATREESVQELGASTDWTYRVGLAWD